VDGTDREQVVTFRNMRITLNADLADVVQAKRSMRIAWAILESLERTERPYMKKFQIEVLDEVFRDVDAGLHAQHLRLLKMANGDES